MRAGHRSGRRRHALAAELPALTTRGRWCGCERCRETSTTTTEPQSSTLSLRHSTPASRSFVLAALRALHLDPAAPRNARPHTRRPRTLPHNNRIPRLTRPHSFRHAAIARIRRRREPLGIDRVSDTERIELEHVAAMCCGDGTQLANELELPAPRRDTHHPFELHVASPRP